ncbi:hypothetical protein TeGR_g828 [Tetraparma gracilis]|uniref:Uncharacterized protein n=1 Tax=Tetraparma gracilis TaxID=2962635 RepID=A0ABQ6M361_9STRA|nr:hypothetical protein TeGR_g828 [Tetraparma gracilis]
MSALFNEHVSFFGLLSSLPSPPSFLSSMSSTLYSSIASHDHEALVGCCRQILKAGSDPAPFPSSPTEAKYSSPASPGCLLLRLLANLPPPPGFSFPAFEGGTPLHLACLADNVFAFALLSLAGADANAVHTPFRRAVVHEAACAGADRVLECMLTCVEPAA